jgi:hypothetical protein
MNTNKTKVVKYDPQGIIRSAANYAPFLLKVDEEMVQKFFTAMAVEQEDGSLVLPESIRSFFAVEVVYEDAKPTPPFEVDIFAAIPSIYDAPKTDSPVSESTNELPIGYADEVDYLSHFEAVTQGEFELAVVDRITIGDLSG